MGLLLVQYSEFCNYLPFFGSYSRKIPDDAGRPLMGQVAIGGKYFCMVVYLRYAGLRYLLQK